MDFVIPENHKSENLRKQKMRQIIVSCQKVEKAVEHEDDSDTNCAWSLWNGPQKTSKSDCWNWGLQEETGLSRLRRFKITQNI